jgi:hypothetical protein
LDRLDPEDALKFTGERLQMAGEAKEFRALVQPSFSRFLESSWEERMTPNSNASQTCAGERRCWNGTQRHVTR